MKISVSFLILSSLFFIHPSLAEKMLKGCEMNDVGHFYQVISDDRTVYWKKTAEAGTYSNGGKGDQDFVIQSVYTDETKANLDPDNTSHAVYACEKQGLHLPVEKDFEALLRCFESFETDARFLTQKGKKDLEAKLSDMNQFFWTASILPGTHQKFAYLYNEHHGIFADGLRADFLKHAVRCISRKDPR